MTMMRVRGRDSLTPDVGDGLWSEDLVLKKPLGLSELQIGLPTTLHKRWFSKAAVTQTSSRGQQRERESSVEL